MAKGEFEARKSVKTRKQIHRTWARDLKVFVPAILQEIDEDGLGRVVALYDEGVEADNIPILQLYAGDGYGENHAHHLPERGFLLVADYPVIDTLAAPGIIEGISQRRAHVFQDGLFIPATHWNDEARPDVPIEEYRYTHNSGAIRRVSAEGAIEDTGSGGSNRLITGTGAIEDSTPVGATRDMTADGAVVDSTPSGATHQMTTDGAIEDTAASGASVRVDETGVTAQHNGHTVEVTDDSVAVTFNRADGQTVDIDVTETDVSISLPDTNNDQATEPRSEVGVNEDGTARVDGHSRVGDSDSYRVDPTVENTDPDDPRDYAETNEPAEPILNPADAGETAYDNPSTTEFQGPVDHGLYESRRFIFPRREADPDPAVTDPTDPAYIELPDSFRAAGMLPVGLAWVNTTEDMLKRTGLDGAIIPIA